MKLSTMELWYSKLFLFSWGLQITFLLWFASVGVSGFHKNNRSVGFRASTALQSRGLEHWGFNLHCRPVCKSLFIHECSIKPTRFEVCQRLLNLHPCCKEYVTNKPLAVFFNSNCQVVCVAYYVCPYPASRLCRELNNNHKCCKTKPPTPPPGPTPPPTTPQPPPTPACDVPDTVCKSFNGHPAECRLVKGCMYNCAENTCVNADEIQGKACYNGCFQHCFDKCGCSQRPECHFDPNRNLCQPSKPFCNLANFKFMECGRQNATYSIGGMICQSQFQINNCNIESVIVALNLGSDNDFTDSQGITYLAEKQDDREDVLEIAVSEEIDRNEILVNISQDADLYSTALVGNKRNCDFLLPPCVTYNVPELSDDGFYELSIRTLEPTWTIKGYRRFSVNFANVEIMSEIDLLTLSKARFRTVDVLVNFRINGTMLSISGHQDLPKPKSLKLSFCQGICGTDNSFVVCAFHIVKLK